MRSLIKKRKDYKPLLWVPNNIFLDIIINGATLLATMGILYYGLFLLNKGIKSVEV